MQNVNFLPYVMTSLNCLLWTGYGILIHDSMLCFVNMTGAVFQFVYIGIYFKYVTVVQDKQKNLKILAGAAAVLLSVGVFTLGLQAFSKQTASILGITCDVFTILMFASPLSTLKNVIQTKNTSTISLPLSVMVVLVSLSWFSYGTLTNDLYVKIPNIVGAALGVIQISLFCVYPKTNGKAANL